MKRRGLDLNTCAFDRESSDPCLDRTGLSKVRMLLTIEAASLPARCRALDWNTEEDSVECSGWGDDPPEPNDYRRAARMDIFSVAVSRSDRRPNRSGSKAARCAAAIDPLVTIRAD